MVLGMSLATFTVVHVVLSLVAILAGFVVLSQILSSQRLGSWNALFLATTVLTTLTGFLFPFKGFTPAIGVGIVSMAVLLVALVAFYGSHLAGAWRWVYVATAMFAFYLNVFVLVVQSFDKIGFLHTFAPTGSEPPFAAVQGIVLLAFIGLGILAVRRFRPA